MKVDNLIWYVIQIYKTLALRPHSNRIGPPQTYILKCSNSKFLLSLDQKRFMNHPVLSALEFVFDYSHCPYNPKAGIKFDRKDYIKNGDKFRVVNEINERSFFEGKTIIRKF